MNDKEIQELRSAAILKLAGAIASVYAGNYQGVLDCARDATAKMADWAGAKTPAAPKKQRRVPVDLEAIGKLFGADCIRNSPLGFHAYSPTCGLQVIPPPYQPGETSVRIEAGQWVFE